MTVKNIRIRIVDNGFIVEVSPFSDGSGPAVSVARNWSQVLEIQRKAIESKED